MYSSKLQDIIDSLKAKETKPSEIPGRLHISIHIPGTGPYLPHSPPIG